MLTLIDWCTMFFQHLDVCQTWMMLTQQGHHDAIDTLEEEAGAAGAGMLSAGSGGHTDRIVSGGTTSATRGDQVVGRMLDSVGSILRYVGRA